MPEKKEEDLQQALNKVFEVGIDEVGRGAIFGPVFAAAVVLTEKNKLILKQFGVTDSKKLTPKKRKLLLPKILLLSSEYGIGQSSAREIDKLGIRGATELSMIRALKKLKKMPSKLMIDGPLLLNIKYPEYFFSNLSIRLSRETLATMLAEAIEINFESPDTMFF